HSAQRATIQTPVPSPTGSEDSDLPIPSKVAPNLLSPIENHCNKNDACRRRASLPDDLLDDFIKSLFPQCQTWSDLARGNSRPHPDLVDALSHGAPSGEQTSRTSAAAMLDNVDEAIDEGSTQQRRYKFSRQLSWGRIRKLKSTQWNVAPKSTRSSRRKIKKNEKAVTPETPAISVLDSNPLKESGAFVDEIVDEEPPHDMIACDDVLRVIDLSCSVPEVNKRVEEGMICPVCKRAPTLYPSSSSKTCPICSTRLVPITADFADMSKINQISLPKDKRHNLQQPTFAQLMAAANAHGAKNNKAAEEIQREKRTEMKLLNEKRRDQLIKREEHKKKAALIRSPLPVETEEIRAERLARHRSKESFLSQYFRSKDYNPLEYTSEKKKEKEKNEWQNIDLMRRHSRRLAQKQEFGRL
ncbi:hypothetical protein PFISCL1PPCAC_27769, partial [Pristionchus fissidentatus]